MDIKIKKRNGNSENFQIAKIKKVINWACENLDVEQLDLERKFNVFLYDGIETKKIHENLIQYASSLASPEEPDWTIVAGRLETMKIWKESKFKEKDFYSFFNYQIKSKIYNKKLFKKYKLSDLKKLSKHINPDIDLEHSYGSVITAKSKYLLKNETIQYMHMANAMAIGSVHPSKDRIDFVMKVYNALSQRKISLATPWLSQLRIGGNISSCFLLTIGDNLNSITNNWKRAANISKNGGGLGIDLSKIRAKGAMINGTPNASGGISGWAKIFNDIAVVVDQGGKRAGAFTVNLPIWHRDIEDFLEIQSEVGDQRKKAYDIFPQISLNDTFMHIQKSKTGSWFTFCPHEVEQNLGIRLWEKFGEDFKIAYEKCLEAYSKGILKNVGEYSERTGSSARNLLKQAMRTQFETGLPYCGFIDTINLRNPNKHDGIIPCVNLCTESFSNTSPDEYSHTCNLASIVVGRIKDEEEMSEISKLTTRILDYGIEITKSPDPINATHNNRYRTIGIGIQGLHDHLVRNKTNYNNIDFIGKTTELIAYASIEESIKIAKELGHYPAFKGSRWDTGEQISEYKMFSKSDLNWDLIQDKIDKYGIRNSQLMSPAPNTSTSIFMDAAAGVMPVYAGFFREDNSSGKFPVSAMHLKENPLGYARVFHQHDQHHLARVMGEMQKFIDTGISAEFIFDLNKENFSAKELYDLINIAWESGMKSVYYIRSIKKGSTIEDVMDISETSCVGCAG